MAGKSLHDLEWNPDYIRILTGIYILIDRRPAKRAVGPEQYLPRQSIVQFKRLKIDNETDSTMIS
jgi:hypothetical protein